MRKAMTPIEPPNSRQSRSDNLHSAVSVRRSTLFSTRGAYFLRVGLASPGSTEIHCSEECRSLKILATNCFTAALDLPRRERGVQGALSVEHSVSPHFCVEF